MSGELHTFAALLAVLGLVVGLRLLLPRLGLGLAAPGRRIRLVESLALAPKRRLHLVEVDGQRLLVASSEQGLSLIREVPEPEATEPPPVAERAPTAERAPAAPRLRRAWVGLLGLLLAGIVSLVACPSLAQGSGDLVIQLPDGSGLGEDGTLLEMLALLTVIAVAPSILLMATSFTRIVIVLAFVRQAIGLQHMPPNQVLVGLALFLTFYAMAPVGEEIHQVAYAPWTAGEIEGGEAIERGLVPVRTFLASHTQERDLALLVELSGAEGFESLDEVPFTAMLPAFLLSELRIAFQIGFMIFLPFLIVDLVVSSMLISMGMIVLPPIVVSLPFKIMLFVLVDGWNLVLGSLLRGLL